MDRPQLRLSTQRAVGKASALLALAVGSIVLAAWLLRPLLGIDAPVLWLMKANTALGVAVLSLAMLLLLDARLDGRGRLRRGLSASVIGLCVATLVQWATGIDLSIDQLLAADPSPSFPGRSSPWAAATLAALALAPLGHRAQRLDWIADLGLVSGGAALQLMFAGYLYGVVALYGIDPLTRVSPQTLTCLTALWIGAIAGRLGVGLLEIATRRSPGGAAVRVLVPVALVLPILLGWVRLLGQSEGLFESTQFGVAVFAVTHTLLLAALILWFGSRLDALESRYLAERGRREQLEQLVAICAWTGQVRWNGRWIRVEKYLSERWGVEVTHTISDEAMRQMKLEIEAAAVRSATPEETEGEEPLDAQP